MPTAEEVAILLAYEFLKKGNYSAAAGPVQMPELAEMAPATSRLERNYSSAVMRGSAGSRFRPSDVRPGSMMPKFTFT